MPSGMMDRNPKTIRCSLTQRIAIRSCARAYEAGTHQRTRDEPSRVECCRKAILINNVSIRFSLGNTGEVFPDRNAGKCIHLEPKGLRRARKKKAKSHPSANRRSSGCAIRSDTCKNVPDPMHRCIGGSQISLQEVLSKGVWWMPRLKKAMKDAA
jgi:hypothetical protein